MDWRGSLALFHEVFAPCFTLGIGRPGKVGSPFCGGVIHRMIDALAAHRTTLQ
tara:strand:- start:1575 stop:1733 length:159 start_codon:yes stop_codon:yes gene_type:complete